MGIGVGITKIFGEIIENTPIPLSLLNPILLIKRLNFFILIIKIIIVFDLNIDSFVIVLSFGIMVLSINERHLTSLTSFSLFGI